MRSLVLVIGVAFGTIGCGPSPPPASNPATVPLEDAVAARYPDAHYVVAVGRSAVSFEDATAEARREVSRTVQSSVAEVTKTVQIQTESDAGFQEARRVYREIEISSRFDHFELIRVDDELSHRTASPFFAVAFLRRAEGVDRLLRAYATATPAFRSAVTSCDEAGPEPLDFAPAWQRLGESFHDLVRISRDIDALSGQPAPAFGGHVESYWRLAERSDELLRESTTSLEVRSRGDRTEFVMGQLQKALTLLGVPAIASDGDCEREPYRLRIGVEELGRRGKLGPETYLRLQGLLTSCRTGDSIAEFASGPDAFRGWDAREKSRALDRSYEAMTPEALAEVLYENLRSSLPVRKPRPSS